MVNRLKNNIDWSVVAPTVSSCVNEQKDPFIELKFKDIHVDNYKQSDVDAMASKIKRHYNGQYKDMTYTVNGCCMVFSRKDFEAVKGFDPDFYPCCGEENDFADKINFHLKKKVIWCKDLYVHHFGGKSRAKRHDINKQYITSLFKRKMDLRRKGLAL
jgi:GT2 family glycosyltransferase